MPSGQTRRPGLVPKPPTVKYRGAPLFRYPDPWWAGPVWIGGMAGWVATMHWSVWAGCSGLIVQLSIGVVTSVRASRQMRRAWLLEWQRLGQEPYGPTRFIPPTLTPSLWGAVVGAIVIAAAIALLAFAG